MTGAAFLLALLLPGLSAAAAPADPELARLVEPVLDQDAARPGGPLLERGAAERDPAHGRRQLLPSARLGDGGLSIRRRWDDRGDLDGPLERQTSQGHQARREGEIARSVRRVGISGEATGIQSQCRERLYAVRQEEATVRIGIIGSGNIGGTAARLLAKAGHEVAISNSRGPESLKSLVACRGAGGRKVRPYGTGGRQGGLRREEEQGDPDDRLIVERRAGARPAPTAQGDDRAD